MEPNRQNFLEVTHCVDGDIVAIEETPAGFTVWHWFKRTDQWKEKSHYDHLPEAQLHAEALAESAF